MFTSMHEFNQSQGSGLYYIVKIATLQATRLEDQTLDTEFGVWTSGRGGFGATVEIWLKVVDCPFNNYLNLLFNQFHYFKENLFHVESNQ